MYNQLVHPDIVKAAWCEDLANEMEVNPSKTIDKGVTVFNGNNHSGWIKFLREHAKELREKYEY